MTTKFADLTIEQQVETMMPLAREVMAGFDLGECELESINHEFNSTFKVTAAKGDRFALRINVNSQRTLPNLKAEVFWVNELAGKPGISVPQPIKNAAGEFITSVWHPMLERNLFAVVYSWLEGEEIGDDKTPEMMRATGRMMARMHQESRSTQLPEGAELQTITDMFWGGNNAIAPSSEINLDDKTTLARAIDHIEQVTRDLYARTKPQLIHADVHHWNVMWHDGNVSIFDFDDCVIGLPIQDLAVTLYYNDTPEQDAALLEGYQEVAPLPDFSESEMKALRLHRRIYLLNYILETQNPEHRAMAPKYLAETIRRVRELLG